MESTDTSQETELVYNLFNLATLNPTIEEGKASYVGTFTALPEGTELRVSNETFLAFKNFLNLLVLEKATSRVNPNEMTEDVLNQAMLTGQIELLTEILNRVTVK